MTNPDHVVHDLADARAQLRETLTENRALASANLLHRRALGWLAGHPHPTVRAAATDALARFGIQQPATLPAVETPQPRTNPVRWPWPTSWTGA